MKKMRFVAGLVMAIIALSSCAWAVTTTDIDGIKGSEWTGKLVKTFNLPFSNNGANYTLPVNVYFDFDNTYVYGAFEADTTSTAWPAASYLTCNAYVYSGTTVGGMYGDGNDVIIEGVNNWLIARDGTNGNWGDAQGEPSDTTRVFSASTGSFYEFSIAKSILAPATKVRVGGQLWNYNMSWQSTGNDLILPISVPEPSSLLALAAGLPVVGLMIRRKIA